MLGKKILYLSRGDVEKVNLGMDVIIQAVEDMFLEKGLGRVEMPPKPGIHPTAESFIHAMPAYIPKTHTAGMKWVSGFPENLKRKLPYITGLIILNDAETGIPVCVMDCTWITAKRTGAATAVAAKYLARKDSEVLGILGCGVQGYGNTEALNCVLNIRKVKAFDTVAENAQKFASQITNDFGIDVEIVSTPEAAVRGCDAVVTAAFILKDADPVIADDWFEKGAFACPVDFDSYWKNEVFQNVDKLYTDDVCQLLYYKTEGFFLGVPEERLLDLGDLVAKKVSEREAEDERIISLNLGLALEDITTAPLVFQKAQEMSLGTKLNL